jgi:hypothetical protein
MATAAIIIQMISGGVINLLGLAMLFTPEWLARKRRLWPTPSPQQLPVAVEEVAVDLRGDALPGCFLPSRACHS